MEFIFLAIFTIECAVKMISLGVLDYFKDSLQVFDFILVLVSFTKVFETIILVNVTSLRVVRSLKILRTFKSIKSLEGLLNSIKSLYESWRSFSFVIMLSCLIIFTFSLVGMNLFGHIEEGENGAIDKNGNFNTFYNSMCLLWVCATGEGWNMVMYDTMEAVGW